MFAEIGDDWRRLPKPIRNALGESRNPWSLAGNAWKTEASMWVLRKVGKLNTPNSDNVDDIYEERLGLENVLGACGWHNYDAAKVRASVNEFVHDIRGEIVHKGVTLGPLHKGGVESWRDLFVRLVNKVEAAVESKFATEWGVAPW